MKRPAIVVAVLLCMAVGWLFWPIYYVRRSTSLEQVVSRREETFLVVSEGVGTLRCPRLGAMLGLCGNIAHYDVPRVMYYANGALTETPLPTDAIAYITVAPVNETPHAFCVLYRTPGLGLILEWRDKRWRPIGDRRATEIRAGFKYLDSLFTGSEWKESQVPNFGGLTRAADLEVSPALRLRVTYSPASRRSRAVAFGSGLRADGILLWDFIHEYRGIPRHEYLEHLPRTDQRRP